MFFVLALLATSFAGAAPYDIPLDYQPPILVHDVRLFEPPSWELPMPAVVRNPIDIDTDTDTDPPLVLEHVLTVEARAAVAVEVLTRAC